MCLLSGFCADQILGRPFLGMVFTPVHTANRVNVRVSAADLRARRICWFDIKVHNQLTNQMLRIIALPQSQELQWSEAELVCEPGHVQNSAKSLFVRHMDMKREGDHDKGKEDGENYSLCEPTRYLSNQSLNMRHVLR